MTGFKDNILTAAHREQRPNLRPTQQVSAQPEVDLGAVAIAAAAIRPPPPQRGYSAERLELDRQELSDRMMKAKMQIESALDMTLRYTCLQRAAYAQVSTVVSLVTMRSPECSTSLKMDICCASSSTPSCLPRIVSDGLVTPCEALTYGSAVPEVAAVRPKAGDELSVPQKTDNFEKFIRGCRSLGLHENDIPSVMGNTLTHCGGLLMASSELQGLSTEAAATTREGQRETALRPKALKVAGVVDAIIAIK